MAVPTQHVTTRSSRYSLGPGADLPIARLVVLLMLAVAIGAFVFIRREVRETPSPETQQLGGLNPRSLLQDNTPHFLPTPVAAIPPDQSAGPPAAAAAEDSAAAGGGEQVKVVNTGGAGAILRAEPPRGRQVAALRDGQVLRVIERQSDDPDAWVHVKTQDGTEGWVYGRLVGPAS
jgi:hypothetical protein